MAKIAIAGYGIEGEQSVKYWLSRGDDVVVVDEQETLSRAVPDGVPTRLGLHVLNDLSEFDLVVRTAGLAPHKISSAKRIWSATNEFFARCPAPIIGVTGTKGKGTTCSLITAILRAAGHTVHLVGNIGQPALETLPDVAEQDIVVYELSSFQLWDLEKSPHIAVVLMIEPDHLDVHASMKEYVQAKATIVRYQNRDDVVIYYADNHWSEEIAAQAISNKIRYGTAEDQGVYVKSSNFFVQDQLVCPVDCLTIAGNFNRENACAAITASLTVDRSVAPFVAEGLRSFHGLPHRLKYVATRGGVDYYDNSIATTPGSAVAALNSFEGKRIIILGGSDKGADYAPVIEACLNARARVIAIGQTGDKIATLCKQAGVAVVRIEGGMREVVAAARSAADGGSTVILSPASASFDQYKSYADRGDQFIEAVLQLEQ